METAELAISGLPLVCRLCGTSFLTAPGIPVTMPPKFDPKNRNCDDPFEQQHLFEVLE